VTGLGKRTSRRLALLGPGMLGPGQHKPCFDRIISDVGDALLPLGIIPHPAIKPFTLPDRSATPDQATKAFRRASLQPFHDGGQRMRTFRAGHKHGVPVIWHDREMGHGYLPVGQCSKFVANNLRRIRATERAGAMSVIEVFLHGPERFPLECGKLCGARGNRVQGFRQLRQPQDGFTGQAVRATHGHEVAALLNLPMGQVAAGKTGGLSHRVGPVCDRPSLTRSTFKQKCECDRCRPATDRPYFYFAGPRTLSSSSFTVAMNSSGDLAAKRASRCGASLIKRQREPTSIR